MQKQRLEWLDILRCIGMYLVVIGHATKGGQPDDYRYYIYAFHMPLFFMISGAGYYLQTKSKTYDFKRMFENKVRALVWPYFTLNFIAFWIYILNFRILSQSGSSLIKRIIGIFYSHQHQVSAVSNATWFLLTLFLTTMAFYVLQIWSKGDERILTLMVLVIGSYGYTMSLGKVKFYWPWHMETVPMALVLFLMGYLFMKYLDPIMKLFGGTMRQILICIACFVGAFCCARFNVKISMAVNTYGSIMLFMGGVIGFSIVCLLISMWIPKFRILKFIGRNTIVYLAFHAPMLRFLQVVSEPTKEFMADYPILTGTAVFIAMIPVAWIFDKYLYILLGRKRK